MIKNAKLLTLVMVASLFSSILLLSGCTPALQTEAPQIRRYALLPKHPAPAANPHKGVLQVRPVSVSPMFNSLSFIYRSSDQGYAEDYYNQFLSSPSGMFTQIFRDGLGASRAFSTVLPDGSTLAPDFTLECVVTAMYADFRNPDKAQAVLELQAFLIDRRGSEFRPIMRKDYSLLSPLPEANAQGYAQALEATAAQALQAIANDLSAISLAPVK
ncbi:PqiC family protein [Desulfobaculum bizertense]|uniref:ABC-type transport auxiliary lipoprotein family protein n=1 Tax=Desulfobaculum bizertense TaxID=376490 RepID=UPI001F42C86D|nr:ABC-type transport auxiliary lipoprotein family protein [Desulfobaculum bizertense]UIJ36843.1 PqiC family protein [Desulfobaculum bizertense]